GPAAPLDRTALLAARDPPDRATAGGAAETVPEDAGGVPQARSRPLGRPPAGGEAGSGLPGTPASPGGDRAPDRRLLLRAAARRISPVLRLPPGAVGDRAPEDRRGAVGGAPARPRRRRARARGADRRTGRQRRHARRRGGAGLPRGGAARPR